MYHYKESGLDNVWLAGGYGKKRTKYGVVVSFEDIEGLHESIGRFIIGKPGVLTGKEFRFLRTELDLSQKMLGSIIGASEQAIARWERGVTAVPETEARFLRALYREHVDGAAHIRELAERLNALDEKEARTLKLRRVNGKWREVA